MMLIPCPHCGPRDETEFHYGGQAGVAYPADTFALSDEQWAQYLFFRDNPKGPFAERWMHTAGCRRWFNTVRDTVSYEFLAVYPCGEQPPLIADLMPSERKSSEYQPSGHRPSQLQSQSQSQSPASS